MVKFVKDNSKLAKRFDKEMKPKTQDKENYWKIDEIKKLIEIEIENKEKTTYSTSWLHELELRLRFIEMGAKAERERILKIVFKYMPIKRLTRDLIVKEIKEEKGK